MSWPSTDRELEIENELQALRKVANAAVVVVALAHVGNPDLGDLAPTEQTAVRDLVRALEALPEPST